jgi:hypothetical protein
MGIFMRSAIHTGKQERLWRSARYFVEYTLTIGAALLCSYWILQGRW